MEEQIPALSAEGFSVRQIARQLGLSPMKVHRVLVSPPLVPSVLAAESAADGAAAPDPISPLLTEVDLARLGVSPAQVAVGGLSPLERYRILGLQSPAGDACRALFDHGRNAEVFDAWMDAGTGVTLQDALR